MDSTSEHINVIPKEGEVNRDDITDGVGRCNRACCQKDFRNLRKHYIMFHLPRYLAGKPDLLTVIPAEGDVLLEDICIAKGTCNRPTCQKDIKYLRAHYQRVHLLKFSSTLKKLLIVIPAEGEVKLEDITVGVGRCNRTTCEKDFTDLRIHYHNVHLPSGSSSLKEPITVIPAEGEVIADDITSGPGRCNRPCCQKEFKGLRAHYRTFHLSRYIVGKPEILNVIPAEGDFNIGDFVFGKGRCNRPTCQKDVKGLRSHYQCMHLPAGSSSLQELLTVIPAVGEVNVEDITSGAGRCNRPNCQKDFSCLRHHYRNYHLKRDSSGRGELLFVIPAEGGVQLQDISYGPGRCNRPTCEKDFKCLHRHYQYVHLPTESSKLVEPLMVIPAEGEVNVEDITSGPGRCNRHNCQKDFLRLRTHYRSCHLKRILLGRGELIRIIPAEGDVQLEDITCGPGRCNRSTCERDFVFLRPHYKSAHLPAELSKLAELLRVIPSEGELNPTDITCGPGRCNRATCQMEFLRLRYHYRSCHSHENDGENKRLRVIPAVGEIKLEDICSGRGRCNRTTCEKEFTCIRAHYKGFHLHADLTSLNEPLTVIPAVGEVNVEDITSGAGRCNRPNCEKDVLALRHHYRFCHSHEIDGKTELLRVIPAEGEIKLEEIFSGRGRCNRPSCEKDLVFLRRHYNFVHLGNKRTRRPIIKEIPHEDHVDLMQLTPGFGRCNREGCKKTVKSLQRHYFKYHFLETLKIKTQPLTLRVIPRVGNVSSNRISTGAGRCNMVTCQRFYRKLRIHYATRHHKKPEKGLSRNTGYVIPRTGNVNISSLTTKSGRCNRGCNRTFYKLRLHYITHHLVHPKHASTIKKNVPARCPRCHITGPSVHGIKYHIRLHHKDHRHTKPIILTPYEAISYNQRMKLAKRSTVARKTNLRILRDVRDKLDKYEKSLADLSSDISKRAQHVKSRMESLFEIPPRTVVCSHVSFISAFDTEWMIPRLVFEIVEKRSGLPSYSSTMFYFDPNVPSIHQAVHNDYRQTGLQRGHLAAAANYHTVSSVAATYYFSNIVPMCKITNKRSRLFLETHIRSMADFNNEVAVAHFPITEGPPVAIGRGVRVPSSIGTIMFVSNPTGNFIYAWELPNSNDDHLVRDCRVCPFSLLQKAGINPKFDKNDFKSVTTA